MAIDITRAEPEDAAEILALSRIVGSETDNLSYGAAGLPFTVDAERRFLADCAASEKTVFLIARRDGELIGMASFSALSGARMCHRGEIGICIRRSAWGMGAGSMLMEALLEFAKTSAGVEIVTLEVRSDNERAIRLYQKFGFVKTGSLPGYFKIDGRLIDFDLMEKML
jgi:RimJ/RimL family protein N-acetyltransferase